MRTNATLTACPSSPPPPPAFCNGAAVGAFASVTPSTRLPSVPPPSGPSGPAMTSGAHAAPLPAWAVAAAATAVAVLSAL
jgi:hypothetical protein